MEPMANVSGHHQRANAIRKFIAKPPARGQRLRLAVLDADGVSGQVLGEWLRSEAEGSCSGPLSHDISEKVQEHSNVMKRGIGALLAWLPDEGERTVTTKTLRARPVLDGEDEEENMSLGIDGSGNGQVIQMQRHMEAMARSYFTAHQAQINTANQLAIASMERVVELQRQNDELTDKYANAIFANMQLAANAGAENDNGDDPEDGNGPKTDEARAELLKRKTAMIDQFTTAVKMGGPVVMQHVLVWAQQQAAAAAAAKKQGVA